MKEEQPNTQKHPPKVIGQKLFHNQVIVNPCISICKTDPVTGFCYGCGRTNDDKKKWKSEETTNEWKENNLIEIQKRLKGWQLESFKESYKNKVENGVSLFKKELIK